LNANGLALLVAAIAHHAEAIRLEKIEAYQNYANHYYLLNKKKI
jgi:CRISPR/Cas system-associated endonuclease Cas3-HD